jgi:hypothetical protein
MRRLLFLAVVLPALALAARGAEEKIGPGVVADKEKRTVTIDAKVAPRKIDDPKFKTDERFKDGYPIEVIACWPYPKGAKAHETVVTIEAKPSDVHKALEALGLKPGTPVMGEAREPPRGPAVNIFLEVPGPDDQPRKLAVDKVLLDPKTGRPMPKVEWRFTGSVMSKPDPDKDNKVYGADRTGTLIAIFPVTDETVFQTNLTMKEEKYVKLETNKKLLPREGTPVKLILEVPAGGK